MAGTLTATLVDERVVRWRRVPGDTATVRLTLDTTAGRAGVQQRVMRFGRGTSRPRRAACEEVWYVLAGGGTLRVGAGRHELEPEMGVLLAPGSTWSLDNPGADELAVVSVRVPAVRRAAGAVAAALVVRTADQPAIATGDREFRVVVDPAVGCQGVTQFVGWIPPGRAPEHSHTYDEVVYVLDGRGRLHLDGSTRPIGPGSCIHLPPPLGHCLENTGTAPLRVLGVFHPAGSPAAKTRAPAR
jgi:mannose-6-phosphate isomerase-like protein (cupin superfamily)